MKLWLIPILLFPFAALCQSTLHERPAKPVDENEVASLSREAALGDSEAAWRLFQYYAFTVGDSETSWYWEQIAAENGDARAQWGLWVKVESSRDPIIRARGEYWLRRSANSGYVRAVEQLKRVAGDD